MQKTKFIISLVLALVMLSAQVFTAFAAPTAVHSITGRVTYVEVVPDESTGITSVLVTIDNEETVRISTETAEALHLIYNDGEGYVIVEPLPTSIEIDVDDVISDEPEHPVGSALATFFSDEALGVDYQTLYDSIMAAHQNGNGFGLIAQALWVMEKLGGNTQDFELLLALKNDGDYSGLTWSDGTPVTLPDGNAPTNWGQFKKLVLNGDKRVNLGAAMPDQQETTGNNNQTNHVNGNNGHNGNNNGRGNGNSNGNGNGNGNGHGNTQ